MQNYSVEIYTVEYSDRLKLRNLMQLYLYDFSEFDRADVNQSGIYDYKYLDRYWTDPNRYPFLIKVGDQLTGFALINRHADPVYNQERWSVAEFFILKKYRRQGIGTCVAMRIFDMFPGKWQVAQIENNQPARTFWRKVIMEYTDEAYEEVAVNNDRLQGFVIYFDNTPLEDK